MILCFKQKNLDAQRNLNTLLDKYNSEIKTSQQLQSELMKLTVSQEDMKSEVATFQNQALILNDNNVKISEALVSAQKEVILCIKMQYLLKKLEILTLFSVPYR